MVLMIPILWGAFIGFRKGLILQLASVAALILGVYGATHFSSFTAGKLTQYIDITQEWIGIIAFMLTFIGIIIGVYAWGKLLDKTLKMAALGIFIRLGGLLFGVLKYLLILCVLIYLFETVNLHFQIVENPLQEKSVIYRYIATYSEPVYDFLEKRLMDTNL